MSKPYVVFAGYELWIDVVVGDGQLGGVSRSATAFNGQIKLAAGTPTAAPLGTYTENLGPALKFEKTILSVVADVVHATAQAAEASVTVTLRMREPEGVLTQAALDHWPQTFFQQGPFDAAGVARLTLLVTVE